jgi:archaellum biogenesis ATPase FlaH
MRVLPKMADPEHYVMDRWVMQQMDQWIATRAFTVATVKAERELAVGNPNAVPGIFRAATAVAAGGSTQARDFFERIDEVARGAELDLLRRIPTGLIGLDTILHGGLQQGEFGMIFGVNSVGKSFLGTAIGAFTTKVEGDDRVLHITNELTVRAQEQRYASYYTNIPKRQLWERHSEVHISTYAHLKGKLRVEYVPPGSTVNEVWGLLEAARLEGKPFKLVIVDYIDQFAPATPTEQKEYLRLIQICTEFSALAKDYEDGGQNVCILAITHAGSQAYGKKWGDGSLMGGSVIGKNKVIDFGLYMGQDGDMERQKLVAVTVTKVRERDGMGGRCYLRQDFDTSRFSDVADSAVEGPQLETPSIPS